MYWVLFSYCPDYPTTEKPGLELSMCTNIGNDGDKTFIYPWESSKERELTVWGFLFVFCDTVMRKPLSFFLLISSVR